MRKRSSIRWIRFQVSYWNCVAVDLATLDREGAGLRDDLARQAAWGALGAGPLGEGGPGAVDRVEMMPGGGAGSNRSGKGRSRREGGQRRRSRSRNRRR